MRVTEIKTIKVSHECYENPIFLSWLNVYGGREYWLFGKVQELGLNTNVLQTFEPNITDITNARHLVDETGRTANKTMTLYANLDLEDIAGVQTLLYSVNVEMLISQSPLKWLQVRPQIGSFKVGRTNETKAQLSFTIELPHINIQGQ